MSESPYLAERVAGGQAPSAAAFPPRPLGESPRLDFGGETPDWCHRHLGWSSRPHKRCHAPPADYRLMPIQEADAPPALRAGGRSGRWQDFPRAVVLELETARIARQLTRGGTSLSTRIPRGIVSQLGLSSRCLHEWQTQHLGLWTTVLSLENCLE